MQMKTACQQCADLTRQLQDAAKEELLLYNNYFVDILFRSMQPRQQVSRVSMRQQMRSRSMLGQLPLTVLSRVVHCRGMSVALRPHHAAVKGRNTAK